MGNSNLFNVGAKNTEFRFDNVNAYNLAYQRGYISACAQIWEMVNEKKKSLDGQVMSRLDRDSNC